MSGDAGLLNVVDVEATCWAREVPVGAVSEIIEIGVTVVDLDAAARLAKHCIVVRPERSRVSEFCTELTGLTQVEVDAGVGFAAACYALAHEYDAGCRPWASWGDYDCKQFGRQCTATGVDYPFGPRHTNIKQLFSQVHGLKRDRGMTGALRVAGLPLEGRHHRGDDDSWNIAALVLDIMGRGAGPALRGN